MHIQIHISNALIDKTIYKIHPGKFNLEAVPSLDNTILPFFEFHAERSFENPSAHGISSAIVKEMNYADNNNDLPDKLPINK